MFLQEVSKHNKPLLICMLFFIAGQLFINFKRGMVVLPFYHYGMYSDRIRIKESYAVFEVYQNGERLRGQDFSPQQWDKIILPLQFYAGINKSNTLYRTDIKRLMDRISISTNDSNFLLKCNYREFENWYKNDLQKITGKKTGSLEIGCRTYAYHSGVLQPTTAFFTLSQLCR